MVLLSFLALFVILFWWSGRIAYYPGRGFRAIIIADSYCPTSECRLTTFELTYPRFIHSELMTHRAFSRNAASSRAIPIQKLLKLVLFDPAMPVWWGRNQAGMQAQTELTGVRRWLAIRLWLFARLFAVASAWLLWKVGLHKQIANRILEPWLWMTTIVSATEYANFFHLRYHKDAQPEFQLLAKMMYSAYKASLPATLAKGDWHMPYISDDDWCEALTMVGFITTEDGLCHPDIDAAREILKKVSTGRCARVSYLNHAGLRALADDVAMHDRLMSAADSGNPGHWSPFEHVAEAMSAPIRCGNFIGFKQHRYDFPNQVTSKMPELPA
jgi:hypothetical protein